MGTTTDPEDPRLGHGPDSEKTQMNEVYLVLSEEERAKGFVRPVRTKYIHTFCGVVTRMNVAIAETYARDPKYYRSTWCVSCEMHSPVSEFIWDDGSGQTVGS